MDAGPSSHPELRPVMQLYVTNVVVPSKGAGLGLRNDRELRTLAKIIDCILAGRFCAALDVATQ
eukprot:5124083-Amphidinium_carterae.1